jgi:hypothetical protein
MSYFGGIFAGSLAAAAAPAARAVFVRLWTVTTLTIAATMVEAVTVGEPTRCAPKPFVSRILVSQFFERLILRGIFC